MTRDTSSPETRVRLRPEGARLAAAASAFLFITILAVAASAQTSGARPVARMIGSSGPRAVLVSPARCADRASFVNASASAAPAANSFERRAFELVNDERRARGQQPFVWDADLASLARQHSENMARQNFFAHAGPDGLDTADRAAVGGLCGWRAIAENIAYNQGFDDPAGFAVERWMVSQKHRDNILRAAFTHAGLGVSRAPDGRIFFTQVFVTR